MRHDYIYSSLSWWSVDNLALLCAILCNHVLVCTSMSQGQPGLLSSVLGYLSREVQDFVSTATGGSTTEVSVPYWNLLWSNLILAQRELVASSSSRPYGQPRREVRRSRRERLNRDYRERGEEGERQGRQLVSRKPNSGIQPHHGASYPSKPPPQRRSPQHPRRSVSPRLKIRPPRANSRPYHGTPSPPPFKTPPLDELVSIDGDSNVDTSRLQEDEQDGEPAPLPLTRALRHQPSITMPGALFPRSPSMDPEATAAVARHVHFPTKPTYFDYEVPVPGPSSFPERQLPPRSIPCESRSRSGSVSETSTRRAQESGRDAGDTVLSVPSWKEKGKQRANAMDVFLESEASSPPHPTTGRGEDHETDAGPELKGADASGEIRVRGKERELSAVRELRREREQLWESEVETTVIREEKAEYEDKIKRLEEEVQWLKAEVCDFSSSSYTVSHPLVSSSLLIIFIFTFKVGKAVYALKIFRRLLVFASDASTAPATAATAYTPCPPSYTNYTSDGGSIVCEYPGKSTTCWHASRSPHQFVVHHEARRTAHYWCAPGQNGGVP